MRELVKPVLTLLSGSVLAQVVIYLARPVLTRLFTPEEFGMFGFYIASVAVLSSMSTGKFDDAVVLPQDHRDAWSLVGASVSVTLALGLLVLALLPMRSGLAALLKNPEAAEYLVWLPLSILLVGTIRVFDSWLTRLRIFSGVATGRVAYAFTCTPSQVAAGSMDAGAGGLIGGIITGQAVQAVVLAYRGFAGKRKLEKLTMRLADIRKVARRYRRFAFFGTPASALNVASVQTPALLLLFFFDAAVLGQYSIAYASLGVPLTLLGTAVAQVYYVSASDAARTNRLAEITEGVVTRLAAIATLPLAAIVVVGPDVFSVVFGDTWREAGIFAQFLAPWIFFLLLAAPLSRLFDVLEKQRELLFYNAALLITRVASIIVGGLAGSETLAIALFGLTGAALSLLQIVWMIRLSGWSVLQALTRFARFAAISLPFLTVIWGSSRVLNSLFVTAIAAVAVLVYVLVLHRLDATLFSIRPDATTKDPPAA
jgi:O-antigen/teichoic acid export membrane protein